MKKILTVFAVIISLNTFAQDSTKIANVGLQASLVEYLAVNVAIPDADSAYDVFIKWRAAFRSARPSGTTIVTIDTIPTALLADLYNYTLSNSSGLKMDSRMKTQISALRTANSHLDRLCTAYEKVWDDKIASLRLSGRRLLMGRLIN